MIGNVAIGIGVALLGFSWSAAVVHCSSMTPRALRPVSTVESHIGGVPRFTCFLNLALVEHIFTTPFDAHENQQVLIDDMHGALHMEPMGKVMPGARRLANDIRRSRASLPMGSMQLLELKNTALILAEP